MEHIVVVDKGRQKALEAAMATLTKRFGEGAVMRLGEATHLQVEIIPTGSLALDRALGAGGIPRGRWGWQDHPGPTHRRRGSKARRYSRLH